VNSFTNRGRSRRAASAARRCQTLLVADRNKEACRVLTRQLVDGKDYLHTSEGKPFAGFWTDADVTAADADAAQQP
jgi:hypothetical protein